MRRFWPASDPRPALAVAVAALAAALASAPVEAARVDRIVEHVPAVAGRPLHVRVTVGHVEVRAEERPDISIAIEREVPDALSPEALPVRIDQEADAVRISALQPGQQRDAAQVARVVVAIPRDTPLLVELAEGDCVVSGTRGALQVTVDRGAATLRKVSGVVRVETRTGDIVVEGAELPPTGLLRARALSGDVTIDLAQRPPDARILLLALSGRVQSSLPLEERGGPGRRIREAVFGSGKALLSVDVVRGDITLRMP